MISILVDPCNDGGQPIGSKAMSLFHSETILFLKIFSSKLAGKYNMNSFTYSKFSIFQRGNTEEEWWVPASVTNLQVQHLVIKFYEDNIIWSNGRWQCRNDNTVVQGLLKKSQRTSEYSKTGVVV